jgi:hypothetical protein
VNAWGAGIELIAALASAGVAWRAAARTAEAAEPIRALTRRDPPATLPADLRVSERAAAARYAGDVHTRLRPLLRDIADERLAARGLSLDDARPLVGDRLWEVIRPDRPRPTDAFVPELSADDVESMLDDLEAI